ncbi:Sec-independent protein translocase protein TatA [Geodia barretti]|uniref:Sec-independent protein translocase protein TatA n=1 Tax=Geodia barretti TaxID=519541 RepID=A0AA35XHV3_GEOBA|nr:Sec-independent protein translocase protein TatA [Geodia barretti]
MGFLRGIGPLEIIIILGLILLVFGWRRMPEIGSSMGKGIRTFKSALLGDDEKPRQDPPVAKSGDESSPY